MQFSIVFVLCCHSRLTHKELTEMKYECCAYNYTNITLRTLRTLFHGAVRETRTVSWLFRIKDSRLVVITKSQNHRYLITCIHV